MPRGRGRGSGSGVVVQWLCTHDYFLRSTRPLLTIECAVGCDEDAAVLTSRLDNVERKIMQLTTQRTTQMGQFMAVMQAAHQPSTSSTTVSTDAFSTTHHHPTDEGASRGGGIVSLGGPRALVAFAECRQEQSETFDDFQICLKAADLTVDANKWMIRILVGS